MSLFQSNLRKQIRKLPKILKSVKVIHYYSISFIRVLSKEHLEVERRNVRLADRTRLALHEVADAFEIALRARALLLHRLKASRMLPCLIP